MNHAVSPLPPSFVHLLEARAAETPDKLLYRYLETGDVSGPTLTWTYAEAGARARGFARSLSAVLAPGERALLLYPPGLDFVAAFLGCLYARIYAVPAFPPDLARPEASLQRLRGVVADARPRIVLTTEALVPRLEPLRDLIDGLRDVPICAFDATFDGPWPLDAIDGGAIAFLQYTSGSTGDPKGVIVSHANLVANVHATAEIFQTYGTSCVSWLPTYHDMGLIGGVLHMLFVHSHVTMMSPAAFLQDPLRWLRAISHFRGSTSVGPDFAYALCSRRATPADVAALDLSCWEVALNGAEPVRPETLERFARTFAPAGFRRSAFCPTYGLAEATLLVSGTPRASLPIVRPRPGGGEAVGCGRIASDHEVQIVDPERLERRPEGALGEIWVRGPCVSRGYWRRPGLAPFEARLEGQDHGYLRTGDLGFVQDGELFVTGRLDDMMVIRGVNHFPHDIEATVEGVDPAIKPGCSAAFCVDLGGEPALVVVAEHAADRAGLEPGALGSRVAGAIAERHGLRLRDLVLIPPRTLPKTSSGKVRRRPCRAAYLAGTLERLVPSATPDAVAPVSTGDQRLLLAIASAVDRAPATLDIGRTLAQQGLDSLAAEELAANLRRNFDLVIDATALYDITPARLCAAAAGGAVVEAARSDPAADVAALEASLPRCADRGREARAEVLLTGATGFVGAFLLDELLRQTRARVRCVVRAADDASARRRLAETLARYALPPPPADRVVVVAGDVAARRFGLDEGPFREIVAQTGAVWHVAAETSWSRPYPSLRSSNVLGTLHAIELAAAAGAPLLHASSVSVQPLGEVDSDRRFLERDPLGGPEGLWSGYAQSKWAAERLIETARSRGLDATVFRLPFVWGHTRSGVDHQGQHQILAAFVHGMTEIGAVPDLPFGVDAAPVDFVARAMVRLSALPDRSEVYHLGQPAPLCHRALCQTLQDLGYPVDRIPYIAWRRRALAHPRRESPIYALRPYYRAVDQARVTRILRHLRATRGNPLDDARARRDLARVGLRYPPLDADLLLKILDRYQTEGRLPPPPDRQRSS